MADEPMPCHSTIDYEDPAWRKEWVTGAVGKLCAGARIFFANISKRSRDPERPVAKPDKAKVFSSPTEFVDHHKSLGLHNKEPDMRTQKQEVARKYSEGNPKSHCRCTHTGDGQNSQHAGALGHGYCTVPGCDCPMFSWKDWTPEFKQTLDMTNN